MIFGFNSDDGHTSGSKHDGDYLFTYLLHGEESFLGSSLVLT